MKKGEIAKRISVRQKRRQRLHRGARLVVLDQRSRAQILKRRILFCGLIEQFRQVAPAAGDLERAELHAPLLDGSKCDGCGSRLLGRRSAKVAMTAYALSRHDHNDCDDDQEQRDDCAGDDMTFQASSRTSVPLKTAWGARLRISFRAMA